jgi:hypothetical protein
VRWGYGPDAGAVRAIHRSRSMVSARSPGLVMFALAARSVQQSVQRTELELANAREV